MGESQGGEEQMNPNGAGQTFFFFFFSTKGKKGNQNAPSLTKVVPYYTLMYAHKHSLARTHARTHADAITCTFNSDKRKEHDRDFSTTASLRMSFICLSRWRTPHKRIFLKELK